MTPQRNAHTRCLFILFFYFLLLSPIQASAEGTRVERTITVTTPSRIEEPIDDATGSASVLTQPEIDVQHPTAAPEVLRDIPGVNVSESGTIGETAILRIRGSEQDQTLIMLDGIRLNTPWRGRVDIGNFIFDEIGQVEVSRGGKSSLYGSDAIGGVVQLKTSRGSGPLKTSLTIEGGSESTFRERLSISGGDKSLHYSASLSRTDTEGQFSNDAYEATSFAGKTGIGFRKSGKLDLIFRYQDDKKELPTDIFAISANTVQVAFDQERQVQREFLFTSFQYQESIFEKLELLWKAGWVENETDFDNPADPIGNTTDEFEETKSRTIILDLQQNVLLSDFDIFSFGVELQWDEVDSTIELFNLPFVVDKSRRNTGIYLQNLLKFEDLFVFQAGIRYDDNSSFEDVTVPNLATTYEVKPTKTQLRASWGKGFRAPTLQDLFLPVFGNPDLKPEKSEDWEIGLRQRYRQHYIDFVYYEIDYENLIQQSPLGIANIGNLKTEGIEITLELHPHSSLIVRADFQCFEAAQDCFQGKNQLENNAIPFRPWRQANIKFLFLPTAAVSSTLDVNWVDWQPISANFLRTDGILLQDKNPGFTRVDFSTSYDFFGGVLSLQTLKIFLKVRNIFDETYDELPGFPSPGIGFFGGITATI